MYVWSDGRMVGSGRKKQQNVVLSLRSKKKVMTLQPVKGVDVL